MQGLDAHKLLGTQIFGTHVGCRRATAVIKDPPSTVGQPFTEKNSGGAGGIDLHGAGVDSFASQHGGYFAAKGVVTHPRMEAYRHAQPGQGNGTIGFSTANVPFEQRRIVDGDGIGWVEHTHAFAKRHNFWHVTSLLRQPRIAWHHR